MSGIDWKDQKHSSAGRTGGATWITSPKAVGGDGGAGPTEILAANPGRVALQIQNVGSSTVYLGFGDTVKPETPAAGSARYAVRLQAGETWWVYLGEGVPTLGVYGTCDSGATGKVAFFELN